MKIKSVELTKDSFKPYGQIMAGQDMGSFDSPVAGAEYTCTTTTEGVEMGELCWSGMLVCESRDMLVKKMEHHANTSEILVAVKEDYVLCVAPANKEGPEMDKIMAFKVEQGTVLVMNRACWHWIPFPAGTENAEILVIFKDKTGVEDLIYADLPEVVEIEN